MSTVHCPLCGLRFTHCTELEFHAREDHLGRTHVLRHDEPPVPPPREPVVAEEAPAAGR